MKRVWKNHKVVFSLLLVAILLSMATSGSLLAEAKIPDFLAIQGFELRHFQFLIILYLTIHIKYFGCLCKAESLKRGIQRRNLKPLPPGGGTPPKPNTPPRHLPPARYK
ncbi:hypothetical protein Goari_016824 [Gossypium aridum]|uniref:Uncharacterized protein n=1 Tax=Gossypium aridum TaxID=34290 RepID=A0A7J8WK78_GOSAI|nr:hypothetical protein [Gossypium aridum]